VPRTQESARLHELLSEHREPILRAWIDAARATDHGHYRQRSREELSSWLARGLDVLAEALFTGSPKPVIDHAHRIGQERWELGFDIDEVTRSLLALKGVVLPYLVEESASDARALAASVAELDACLESAVAECVRLFAESMRTSLDQVHEQRERVAVLEERQRLARDIHDSATQSMYGISLHAEAATRLLKSGENGRAQEYLRQVRESALEALRELRLLIFELHPAGIREKGLAGALRHRLGVVEERAGLATSLACDPVEHLPPRVSEGLYGIAREALNNCLRHARASSVAVRLRVDGRRLELEVEDDGVGFDPARAGSEGGLGLPGMRDRVRRLGGELSILSRPGEGTRITVRVDSTRGTAE
jgi:signal transduction histidine kinase